MITTSFLTFLAHMLNVFIPVIVGEVVVAMIR